MTSLSTKSSGVVPHTAEGGALLKFLGVDSQVGLNKAQVTALRELHGLNQLVEPPATPVWRKLLALVPVTSMEISKLIWASLHRVKLQLQKTD